MSLYHESAQLYVALLHVDPAALCWTCTEGAQMATAAVREQPQVLSLDDSSDHGAPTQIYNGGFMSPDSYEDLMWQGLGSDSGDDFRHPTERAAELIQQLVAAADSSGTCAALVQLLQPQLLDEDICSCQQWLQLCSQLPSCWVATTTTTSGSGSSSPENTQPVISTWAPDATDTTHLPATQAAAAGGSDAAAGSEPHQAAAAAAAAAGRLATAATCVLWKLSGLLLAPGSICFLGELLLPLLPALLQAQLCSCALPGALPPPPTPAAAGGGEAVPAGGGKRLRPTLPQDAGGSSSSLGDKVRPPPTPAVGPDRPTHSAAAAAGGEGVDAAADSDASEAAVGGMLAFVHLAMDALAQGWHLLEPRQGPALAQLLLQLVQQPLQAAGQEGQQQQQVCGGNDGLEDLRASIAARRQQLRGLLQELAAPAAGLDATGPMQAGPPGGSGQGTPAAAATAAVGAAAATAAVGAAAETAAGASTPGGGCQRCRCSMTAADVLLQLDPALPWLQRLASLGGPCGHLAPLLHTAMC